MLRGKSLGQNFSSQRMLRRLAQSCSGAGSRHDWLARKPGPRKVFDQHARINLILPQFVIHQAVHQHCTRNGTRGRYVHGLLSVSTEIINIAQSLVPGTRNKRYQVPVPQVKGTGVTYRTRVYQVPVPDNGDFLGCS
jgi:hypothetical protein